MYLHTYIHTYIYAYLHTYLHMCASPINRSHISRSKGFTIPRLYNTYHQFLRLYWTYLRMCMYVCVCMYMCMCVYVFVCICVCIVCVCVCVYLFCIYDVLQLTSTFPHHRLNRYSLSKHRHRSPSPRINFCITTPTRCKYVLKSWKYYAYSEASKLHS